MTEWGNIITVIFVVPIKQPVRVMKGVRRCEHDVPGINFLMKKYCS